MNKSGFTLLETLIYIAIFSFIIASIFGVTWVLIPNTVSTKDKILYQRDLLYTFQSIEKLSDRFEMDDYIVQDESLVLRDRHGRYVLLSRVNNFEANIVAENEKYKVIKILISGAYGTSTYSFKKYENK